jgi:hypothetical protein
MATKDSTGAEEVPRPGMDQRIDPDLRPGGLGGDSDERAAEIPAATVNPLTEVDEPSRGTPADSDPSKRR